MSASHRAVHSPQQYQQGALSVAADEGDRFLHLWMVIDNQTHRLSVAQSTTVQQLWCMAVGLTGHRDLWISHHGRAVLQCCRRIQCVPFSMSGNYCAVLLQWGSYCPSVCPTLDAFSCGRLVFAYLMGLHWPENGGGFSILGYMRMQLGVFPIACRASQISAVITSLRAATLVGFGVQQKVEARACSGRWRWTCIL